MIRIEHRVNFYETDAMSVAYHGNYVNWFEMARVACLRASGITLGEIMRDGYVFPIIDVRVKYLSPAYFDDLLCIEVEPIALTRAKMEFSYRVYRKGEKRLLTEGYTRNVFTHKETGKIARLPEKYYEKLQKAMQFSDSFSDK